MTWWTARSPKKFLSTLSLRRATAFRPRTTRSLPISIHALLAESDHSRRSRKQRHQNFYPRSPCGERLNRNVANGQSKKFLSTLSLRRATPEGPAKLPKLIDFYPRSPCGERPSRTSKTPHLISYFYPRSPCGERLPADVVSV